MSGQQEMYNHARDFREKVSNCIDSSEEIIGFYQALKHYNSERDVTQLVKNLMPIINAPKRHILFDEVASLIGADDYEKFVSEIPPPPSDGIRIIKIRKLTTESLGFSIRGGKEHGVGVFVSSVLRGSKSDIAGLKLGDEILRVNGFLISESTHGELVGLIRTRRNLRLKVRSARKYPERLHGKLSWKDLDGKENMNRYHPGVLNHLVNQLALVRSQSPVLHIRETDKHVKFIVGPMGLGCSVRNGIPTKHGVFVIHVSESSLAERVGITVGDQIIALNKKNFANIKYSEAVQLLKTTKEYDMVLRPCKEAREFVEFSRSKGYAIVSGSSDPPSPEKKPKTPEEEPKSESLVPPVTNGIHVPLPTNDMYAKAKKPSRKRSSSKSRQRTMSEQEKAQNLTFTGKDLGDREPKFVRVEKRDLLVWVFEERDKRIYVQLTGGVDNAKSGVKVGDQLACVGDVKVIGLSLRQVQTLVDEVCRMDEDTVTLVMGVEHTQLAEPTEPAQPSQPAEGDAPPAQEHAVGANWSFSQKDLSTVKDKELMFDTKF